jgi:hypothetical protein
MTVSKLIEVLEFYRDFLHQKGISPVQFSETCYGLKAPDPLLVKRHLAWMVREQSATLQTETPLSRPSVEKAMRWLGYIQGELRALGYFSVGELRDHSRTVSNAREADREDVSLGAVNGVPDAD